MPSMCIPSECKFQSPPAKSLSALVTKIQGKDVPLQILIGWTRQAGRLLNLSPPIRRKYLSDQSLGVNSATCFATIKLEFGVAWVQDNPAKIMTSAVKV
jgi:hypothetical protein